MRKSATALRRALSLIFYALFIFALTTPLFADGETAAETAPSPGEEPATVVSAEPELEKVGSAYLYNFETDTVLYELNAEAEVYPTSTVKIMTGIVALEKS